MTCKNIHQIWLNGQVPGRYSKWVQSVKECHPEWKYRLWDSNSIRDLISSKFSWFLPTYDSYSYDIQRCDSARYFILYEYGGIYIDLDIECYMNVEPLINNDCVLFYEHPGGTLEKSTPGPIVTNSIYYADRQNKFMQNCTRNLKIWKQKANKYTDYGTQVFYSTSPGFMSHMYYRYSHVNNITVRSHKCFEALSKRQRKNMLVNNHQYDTRDVYGIHWNVGEWLQVGDSSKINDSMQT